MSFNPIHEIFTADTKQLLKFLTSKKKIGRNFYHDNNFHPNVNYRVLKKVENHWTVDLSETISKKVDEKPTWLWDILICSFSHLWKVQRQRHLNLHITQFSAEILIFAIFSCNLSNTVWLIVSYKRGVRGVTPRRTPRSDFTRGIPYPSCTRGIVSLGQIWNLRWFHKNFEPLIFLQNF